MNRSAPESVEVFGLGVPGVGPRFALRLLELEHQLVQPDVVIFAFFVGNDFTDEQAHGLETWTETAVARHSYAFRLFRNLLRLRDGHPAEDLLSVDSADRAGENGEDRASGHTTRTGDPAMKRSRFLWVEGRRMQISTKAHREEFVALAGDVGRVLGRFRDEVEASGSEFLVLIIPDCFQTDNRVREGALQHLGLSPEEVDIDLPQRHLGEILNGIGVAYLDLLPRFREHPDPASLYRQNGTHWTPRGNRLAGLALAEHIQTLKEI